MDPTQQPIAPAPIVSTEIPISDLPSEKKSKKKKLLIIIAGILIVLLLIVGIFFISRPKSVAPKTVSKPKPTPTPVISTILPIDRKNHEQILFSYVPHFADMKLSDIATLYDIRGIFNYKKNLLIVTSFGITELNPTTDEFIRQNDTRLFNYIDYATLIGKNLYVACTGKGVYVINLESGKLEKTYQQGSALLSHISLGSEKDNLWVGGANEIVKIQTKNDSMEEYSPENVGLPECTDFSVFAYSENVWTTCGSKPGISIYTTATNSWKSFTPPRTTEPFYTLGYNTNTMYFRSSATDSSLYTYHTDTQSWDSAPATKTIPSSKPEAEELRALLQKNTLFPPLEQKGISYLSYFDSVQKKVIDFELTLSDYIGISDIIDEKRYLFTSRAVDRIQNKQFPKAFKKLDKPVGIGTKVFVDSLENYAVLIGSDSAKTPPFTAYLIELKKGTVTDLLLNNESIEDIEPDIFNKFSATLDKNLLTGTRTTADMKEAFTGNQILHIDFPKKELIFSEY